MLYTKIKLEIEFKYFQLSTVSVDKYSTQHATTLQFILLGISDPFVSKDHMAVLCVCLTEITKEFVRMKIARQGKTCSSTKSLKASYKLYNA